jgi:threonine-phosphate decarboxylase
MIKGHGGNIYALAQENGCALSAITDMSSNVNPFGSLPGLRDHLAEKLASIESLPEPDAGNIAALFAEHCGVAREQVAPGNGSTQLLYALPRALETRRALIVGPTYADYASACRQQGVHPDFLLAEAENHFRPDLARLASVVAQYDTVFICNPNNPTGVLVSPAELAELCAAHPETVFIVDESYLPFVDAGAQPLQTYGMLPNVVRMTSMSKIFKIPGLRIGFAVARAGLIARLQQFAMPWSVNSLACAAVAYILDHPQRARRFVQATRTFLSREQASLLARFRDHPGIQWYPSATSFLLARLRGALTAKAVCTALAAQRVLIRNCANFEGLDDRYFRVSLKSSRENQHFGDILAGLLEKD